VAILLLQVLNKTAKIRKINGLTPERGDGFPEGPISSDFYWGLLLKVAGTGSFM